MATFHCVAGHQYFSIVVIPYIFRWQYRRWLLNIFLRHTHISIGFSFSYFRTVDHSVMNIRVM